MTDYFAAAAKYGRTVTVAAPGQAGGRQAKAYIYPMDAADGEIHRKTTRAGKVNRARYLLIAEPAAIAEGETDLEIEADGRVFQLLRAEPVYVSGVLGHWEGVLRLKGGAADA